MTLRIRRLETALLAGAAALIALACFGPFVGQPANHHHFADGRTLLGIPHAMDVLSNLPFAMWAALGAWGLLGLAPGALSPSQRSCAALFFVGLLVTTAGSSFYHWQPDDAGLAIDRLGMVLAFAGLLGLALAGRISARAGVLTALAMLVFGPISVWVWASTGNVLPWAVAQFGGMLVVLALLALKPLPGALHVRLGLVIFFYALAKLFELADHPIYDWSGQLLSGHTLKHVVASLAAWPVLSALTDHVRRGQNAPGYGQTKYGQARRGARLDALV